MNYSTKYHNRHFYHQIQVIRLSSISAWYVKSGLVMLFVVEGITGTALLQVQLIADFNPDRFV